MATCILHHFHFIPTFEFDAQLGEGLLHTLTLPLPHEAIVNVNRYNLVLVQSFVEESCAHGGVHSATQQHLRTPSEANTTSNVDVYFMLT